MSFDPLYALRTRKDVIDMGFEMLSTSLANSKGDPTMSNEDIKSAILGLQTVVWHQQALIETLFTAVTTNSNRKWWQKILGK